MKKFTTSQKKLKSFLTNKTIFITGSAGSIGSAIAKRALLHSPKKLILIDNNETDLFRITEETKATPLLLDITNKESAEKAFQIYKPEIVIHTAAYKHVAMLEKYPLEAIKNNIGGGLTIMGLAVRYKVNKFVFVSTDKAVNPTSVMGGTKYICEEIALLLNEVSKTKFIITRFGNVLASRGSVVEIFNKQIAANQPLTITDSLMKRFTMGIYEAANLVLEAANQGKGGEKFIFDMGEPVFIVDLAKLLIKLSGKDLDITIIGKNKGEKIYEELFTAEEKQKAIKKGKLFIIK